MTDKNDLGIAILKYLIDKGGQVGYLFSMNDFLENYIKETNDISKLNTWIAREIIEDLYKMGYVNTLEKYGETGIYNYGRPEEQHKEPKGGNVTLGLTWKGKAFYYEHVNKGKFDKREKRGLIAIIIMTAIAAIAALIQTTYTIIDHCKSTKSHIETTIENQPPTPENHLQKNGFHDTQPTSKCDSSQQNHHTLKTTSSSDQKK